MAPRGWVRRNGEWMSPGDAQKWDADHKRSSNLKNTEAAAASKIASKPAKTQSSTQPSTPPSNYQEEGPDYYRHHQDQATSATSSPSAPGPVSPSTPAAPRSGRAARSSGRKAGGGGGGGGKGGSAPAAAAATTPGGIDPAERDKILKQYPDKAWMLDDPELSKLLKSATDEGWSAEQMRAHLTSTNWFKIHGTALYVNQLKSERAKWLVPMGDGTLTDWAMRLSTGQAQPGEFQKHMQDQAKVLFGPEVGNAIDRGVDVRTFVDPYIQHAARELGVNPDTIDMTDAKWLKAIQNPDPKTGAKTVMSLSDWDNMVRSDSTYGWQTSANGKKAAYDVAETVGQAMGKVP